MRLAQIYRHPVKAIGLEPLDGVTLEAGARMPGDRVWAVAHEAAKLEPAGSWARCVNFVRGASSAKLMAVRVETDGAMLRFTHPERDALHIDPSRDGDALLDWVRPLCDADRAAPAQLVRAADGMTDNRAPWLSLLSRSSLDALGASIGISLEPERFRANLWFEGAAPGAERDWAGQDLRLGGVRLRVTERIKRCVATGVNTRTGARDADTLAALKALWGDQDFGVFVEVVEGGPVATGDNLELL